MTTRKNQRKRRTTPVRPPTQRRDTEPTAKTFRVIAVSLYLPEIQWVDETTAALRRGGNPKANRSFVVREAILRLQESLRGKSDPEMVHDFAEHHVKRTRALL